MARIKKFGDTRLEKLSTFQTFLVDDNPNSTYFRISEFKDTYTGGKNGFLIEGSEFLKETTEIKIEILDVEGNPIYFEPGDGIPEYYEGVSKLVSVHIYEDTPIGIGKITILGELKNFLDNGDVIRPVPDDWKGLYNVKWEKDFKINRLLSNEDKVRFFKRPVIDIQEISRPIFTATPTLIQQSGIVSGLPIIPAAGTRLVDFSLPTTYLLTIADNSNWTASVVGNPITLPNLGVQLQSTDVITNKQLSVSTPYVVGGIVQPFFNQPYTASFNFLELDSTLGTALSGSFAKIDITDLTTFVGDVARVKVFRKSQSEVSDFQFVQEIPLESNEILIDLESSQRNQELYGLFTPFVLQNYWVTSSNNLTIDFNQDFLYNSVELNSVGTNRFSTIKDVPINVGIEYTFGFNIRLEENISNNNSVVVYLEGIRNGLNIRQPIITLQSSNGILQKSNVGANFIAEEIQNAKLFFEVTGNGWYISDVSLRASQESAFSPDEITFIQPVPRTLETETFDFRFEFYDINNNFIPVLVEKTQTFNGGNLNRIAKSIELLPSSLYFQFDSGSGTGNPLPPTAIFIDVVKEFLTGSTNFTSRSFDFDNNQLSASAYIGEQYPGLLIEEDVDRFRLTVQNFTGSKNDTVVQYIEYVAECEGVSDTIVITRISDGKGGVNFEIRPFGGTVIRNKDEFATLEVQAVRIDGINETNLVSGLPLNQSDTKLFVQSGSQFLTITEASSSGFLKNVVAGTTGSGELDYNAVFDRESIVGQLVLFLIPSSSLNRAENIVSTLTLTDILDGLDAGFIQYDIDVFTINPRTEVVFTPVSASVTGSYHRRGTTDNPISASVIIYPSMSINEDFVPQFWMNYFTGSINSDIIVTGFDEVGNLITPILPTNFVGDPLFQNKQLTLSFNYIEPFTSESVLVEHTFNIIPEGIPGQDAINVEIVPSVVVLSADEIGNVTEFTPSQTEIKVKQGSEFLRYQSQRQPGTFFLTNESIQSEGITNGTTFTQVGNLNSVFISEASEFIEDIGSVTYPLEIRPFFTSSFFIQSVSQSFTKVYAGANARSVSLIASTNVVNYDGNGNVVSPDGDITLTATAFNTTGSAHFQFFKNGTELTPPTSINFGGNILEIGSGFAASPGQTSTFRVQLRDGDPDAIIQSEAQISITGVQSAAESFNVQLTNENSSIVASVQDILILSGSGTDIVATKGIDNLQAVTSFSPLEFDQLGNVIPNGEYIVKIASKPSYITLAGGLVSGSTVPVVGGVARIGDITAWSTFRENPTAQIVYEINLEDGRQISLKTQSISVQFEGDTGPGIVFRGEWTGSINYIYNVAVRRRDAVLRNVDNGVHYWATTELLVTASSPPFTQQPLYPAVEGETDAGGWEYLGEQDLFVAAKIAIFEESFVKNTINVGNNPNSAFANIVIAGGRIDPYIAVGQNGTVGADGDQITGGVIGYDRPGVFMGTFDTSGNKTPRFSLKNNSTGAGERFLRWDGANLQINGGNITLDNAGNLGVTGTINATAGNFTGFVTAGTMRFGAGVDPGQNGIRINPNNYWYDTGNAFKVGNNSNSIEWNGSTLTIVGGIRQISPGVSEGRVLGIWANIADGFAIFERDIVTHNGRTWVANANHSRGSSFVPGVSGVWEIAADAGTSGTAGSAGANGTNGTDGAAGSTGGPGPGVVFRGEFSASVNYFHTAIRRDIVEGSDGNYYLTNDLTENGNLGSVWGAPPSANWEAFGAQFSSVATGILLAEDATITRGLVMGEGDGGSSFIRSSGATSLTNGVGYFLSSSGNFRFGDGVSDAGSFVSWNGTELEIGGIIKTRGSQNSQLGNWVVDGEGRFRDSGSKLILDAENRAIEIFDTSNDLKLSVRQGSLPNPLSAASVTITTPVTSYPTNLVDAGVPALGGLGFGTGSAFSFFYPDVFLTGSTTPTAISIVDGGGYRASPAFYPSAPSDFLTLFDGNTDGLSSNPQSFALFTIDAELHTVSSSPSALTKVASWRLGFAELVFGNNRTDFFPNAGNLNIFLETGTYFMFTRVSLFGSMQSNHYLRIGAFVGAQISSTSNVFNLNLNKVDITDEGILVIGNSDNFARMRRTQSGETLTVKGISKFISNAGSGFNTTVSIETGSLTISGVGNSVQIVDMPANLGGTNHPVRWVLSGQAPNNRLYYSTSTKRHKKDIIYWDKSSILEKIKTVNPVTFRYNNWDDLDPLTFGMIAEDLDSANLNEAVIYETISGSKVPLSIDYEKVAVILWRGVQELSQKVNDLEAVISGSNNL